MSASESHQLIPGRKCYPDLESIPRPVVEAAIAIGVRAREAGLLVVMDRCMMKESQRLTGGETMPDSA